MPHCDPETLSLISLGEPTGAQDADHLSGCDACRAELAALSRVVSAVRVTVPDGPPVAPPQRVWESIAAATQGATATPSGPAAPADTPTPSDGTGTPSDVVRPLPLRRQRPRATGSSPSTARRLLLAVAAAALVVGGLAGSLVTRLVTEEPPVAAPQVVTQTQLVALPQKPPATGRATIVKAADGTERLVVDVSDLTDLSGPFYEVWLIDTSVEKMVAVGVLSGDEGQFALPAGLNLSQYPIVDISIQEPGDPTHSGNSVLRGTLPT